MTSIMDTDAITELLARLEKAESLAAKLFWQIVDTCVPPAELDNRLHSRLAGFVDAGAWTEAALALVERVLPGWFVGLQQNRHAEAVTTWTAYLEQRTRDEHEAAAASPALAVLIALCKALIASDGGATSATKANSGPVN